MSPQSSLRNPEYYTNRELSWLLFNRRVLSEAQDPSIPLFERLKFLSITASNLDEFFMVRIASLQDMVHAHYTKPDIAGYTPQMQLRMLAVEIHDLVQSQYATYRELLQSLSSSGIEVVSEFTGSDLAFINQYFETEVYPVLTPMAVDSSRPFPLLRNKSLNLGALVTKKSGGELEFATVQVPSVLPRLVEIPGPAHGDGPRRVAFLEEIIRHNVERLFSNYDIVCVNAFRIMRNADLEVNEDEASDLLLEIEKQLKKRQWGEAIRLEVEEGCDERLLEVLSTELHMQPDEIYEIDGPLDLTFLMKVYGMDGYSELKNVPYVPQPVPRLPADCDIFEAIREGDIFLHHPYETFTPVVDFIRSAAADPDVLAIKQTLYRVSGHSPIIAALAQAAENGKQVTVLVELKARFDEENNIVWARKLEKAGCHVIYGLVGLKTHCKITLVVRREDTGIRRYVHLATGNYNDSTAKLYTDIGMLTCSEAIGEDATAVFNMLSGYSEPTYWNKLSLAPLWLKNRLLYLINREREAAKCGQPARIIAKMNALCDPDIIEALYAASGAGVRIDLIVRGICCLKVGIPGVSETITVRSIVGNFLEHSRIFYFENNGSPDIFCSSADWMPRNLERRVEIMFPIEGEEMRMEIMHILGALLSDNQKAHILQPDGTYRKVSAAGRAQFCAQETFCREAAAAAATGKKKRMERVFVPEQREEAG